MSKYGNRKAVLGIPFFIAGPGDLGGENSVARSCQEHGPLQPHPDVRVLQVSGADAVPRENPPRGNSGSPDCGGGRLRLCWFERFFFCF